MTALTITAVTMRDSAYPSSIEPSEIAELVYVGGDTPNPLPLSSSNARYRLPCWVRSNPGSNLPQVDTSVMIGLLRQSGVPQGSVTILDLETAVDPGYVNAYGAALHAAGYLVWPYGSPAYLFNNPRLDGYFVANPTTNPPNFPHLWPGSVATQWGYFGGYDLSSIAAGEPLWDTAPPPVPPSVVNPVPVLPTVKEQVHMFVVENATAPQGFFLIRESDAVHIANGTDLGPLMAVCGQIGVAPQMSNTLIAACNGGTMPTP